MCIYIFDHELIKLANTGKLYVNNLDGNRRQSTDKKTLNCDVRM